MTAKPWPDEFQLPPVGPYGWEYLTVSDEQHIHSVEWYEKQKRLLAANHGNMFLPPAAGGRDDHAVFADEGPTDTQGTLNQP